MFHYGEAERLEMSQVVDTSSSSAAYQSPPSPSSSVAASPYWGKSTQVSTKPSSASAAAADGFSPFVGFCFTINYILGTGFLTIPWAFNQGGLVLSTIMIVIVGIFSDVAKNFLLETMARAEAMLDGRMHWIKKRHPSGDDEERHNVLLYSPVIVKGGDYIAEDDDGNSSSSQQLLLQSNNGASAVTVVNYESVGHTSTSQSMPSTPIHSAPGTPTPTTGRRLMKLNLRPPQSKYLVKRRKFEVNSLCRVFLGKLGLRIYTASICLYLYCTLWAYTSVFAGSMAGAVPLFFGLPNNGDHADNVDDRNYLIFAAVFAVAVVPLSCMEMDEQVVVQVAMTGARFLMLGLMLGTSSLCAMDSRDGGQEEEEDSVLERVPMVRFSGISKMAPVMVFAHIYHHSIPGLAQPVGDKTKLSGMFQSTTIFSTFAYAFVGLVLSSNFGNTIEQSANLNWKGFTGGTAVYDDDGKILSVSWWAEAVSLYVLCFPALDVVSAFPLNAMTLGNNMMGSFYGKRIHEVEENRWIRTQFRLLASVPPIIFGILERQLGTITDYAGTTGFVIGFSFPALLYLRSCALAERKHFSTETFYSGYSSSKAVGWMLFSFGIMMVVYVVYFLVRGEDSGEE